MTYGVINKNTVTATPTYVIGTIIMIFHELLYDLLLVNDFKLDLIDVPDRYVIRKWVGGHYSLL